jgi:hypothetical protein
MSISSSSGLCKAIRISLIATYPDKNYVSLSLHNLEHKKYFKLRFYIHSETDTPESIIDEMKKDALITISNPIECAKLLTIYHCKNPSESDSN